MHLNVNKCAWLRHGSAVRGRRRDSDAELFQVRIKPVSGPFLVGLGDGPEMDVDIADRLGSFRRPFVAHVEGM